MPDEPTPTDPGNPAPAPPVDPAPAPTPDPKDEPLGDAGTKALDAMKARARDAEKKAKELESKLTKLEEANLNEVDKAILAARQEGASEARQSAGTKLAEARIEAALTGIVPDPASIVEDLNVARYLTEDGDVDLEAVAKLRAKYEGFATTKPVTPGVPAGARQGETPGLAERIAQAQAKGDVRGLISLNTQLLQESTQAQQ